MRAETAKQLFEMINETINEQLRILDDVIRQAMDCGWRLSDCELRNQEGDRQLVLVVGGTPVFSVSSRVDEETCELKLESKWLQLMPKRIP